jgi:hypothetical protein
MRRARRGISKRTGRRLYARAAPRQCSNGITGKNNFGPKEAVPRLVRFSVDRNLDQIRIYADQREVNFAVKATTADHLRRVLAGGRQSRESLERMLPSVKADTLKRTINRAMKPGHGRWLEEDAGGLLGLCRPETRDALGALRRQHSGTPAGDSRGQHRLSLSVVVRSAGGTRHQNRTKYSMFQRDDRHCLYVRCCPIPGFTTRNLTRVRVPVVSD